MTLNPVFTRLLLLVCLCLQPLWGGAMAQRSAPEGNWPLKLGLQAYTFRSLTLVQTLEQAQKLGLKYVQVYPGQRLGEGFDEKEVLNHKLTESKRDRLLEIARKHGVQISGYGVVNGKDAADWEAIFAFAQSMGMNEVAISPAPDTWPTVLPRVIELSKKYGIAPAFHNKPGNIHPLELIKQLDAYDSSLGLCADTAHWARSGIDPALALRGLKGRIVALHLSDVDEMLPEADDMPFGTGVAGVAEQMAVLRDQKFEGIVYVEYERLLPSLEGTPAERLMDEVTRSVEFLNRLQNASEADLLASTVPPPGFVRIAQAGDGIKIKHNSGQWPAVKQFFNTSLSNAVAKNGWKFTDGILTGGSGNLLTKASYHNFIATFEVCIAADSASAFYLLVPEDGNVSKALKVQLSTIDENDDKHLNGAIYDVVAPRRLIRLEPDQWYRFIITRSGGNVQVDISGDSLVNIQLRDWKEAGKNVDGTPNPYNFPLNKLGSARGAIGFEAPRGKVEFRDLTIDTF